MCVEGQKRRLGWCVSRGTGWCLLRRLGWCISRRTGWYISRRPRSLCGSPRASARVPKRLVVGRTNAEWMDGWMAAVVYCRERRVVVVVVGELTLIIQRNMCARWKCAWLSICLSVVALIADVDCRLVNVMVNCVTCDV
jgi:hypothetical protein